MDIGTVSFDDLFDFSPEPPQELSDNSYELEREKMRLSGGDWEVRESQQQFVRTITNTHQLGLNKTGSTKVKVEPEVAVNQLWEELPETEPSEVGDSGRSYEGGRRGRRSGSKPDIRVKLERSRQSARECRARKKLRYQYLDDMILEREGANDKLREELLKYVSWCQELDRGRLPDGLQEFLEKEREG